MSTEPVGLKCPGCGEPPVFLFGGGTQAFCQTDDCPWFTWDPTKSTGELLADAKVIDLHLTEHHPVQEDPEEGKR